MGPTSIGKDEKGLSQLPASASVDTTPLKDQDTCLPNASHPNAEVDK
jgi:hypothetical protein